MSDSTKAVLDRLESPVEIRFYSLLDPASVSGAERAFARRVDQLLTEYQREANGKITVARHDSRAGTDANAASSDGIQPFNLDKGDACFLGVALQHADRMESLPRLFAEWEQALEFDVTRAIVRVTSPKPPPRPLADTSQAAAATDEVKRAIPNLASVSVEEGTRLLREAALTAFAAAAKEMEARVTQVRQQLVEAQNNGGQAEQDTARKELLQVQAEQAEKLKEIGRRLEAQIVALERLKGVPPRSAPSPGPRTGTGPTR